MAPRGTYNKKRSARSSYRRGDNHAGWYHRGAAASSFHAPAFDENDDGGDNAGKIQFLGISFPNPLSYLRGTVGGGSGAASSLGAGWTPTRIILFGGVAAVLLAPLFDTFLRESLAYLRGTTGPEDANGIVGDALPHVTSDGKFHGRYPNSLLVRN